MLDEIVTAAQPCATLSRMSARPLLLVARRHVDYGRVRSMICMPA